MDEAREIYNEAVEILDAALETGIADHDGKYFKYESLRLLPRPAQKPSPPKWSTVVNTDTAQRAVRRNSKICTGFVTKERVREIFQAYLAEARSLGLKAGSDHLALRRRVIVAESESAAKEMSDAAAERFKTFAAGDSRMKMGQVPDAPGKGGGFSLSADEFISGTPEQVADQIIEQCRFTGAGHFLAVMHWGAELDEVRAGHELFGQEVIPLLRKADL
jgi:alkanesulfonate monooxygenase SsuD/methylene tetrahydromethanopterin reductase-like flavin-dependent oxidoreductase (luciferase family)